MFSPKIYFPWLKKYIEEDSIEKGLKLGYKIKKYNFQDFQIKLPNSTFKSVIKQDLNNKVEEE